MAFLDETGLAELWSLICDKHDGFVNEYVWAKSATADAYVIDATAGTSNLAITNDTKYGSKDNAPGQVVDLYTNFSYYKTLSVNKDTGALSLSDQFTPTSAPTNSYSGYWGGLIPFYVKTSSGNILQVVSLYSPFDDHIEFKYNLMQSSLVDETVIVGYVNSPDPSAYPVDDGYTYTALGQLGAKVQIATGSYTGTGTYGASNPSSLTFDFEPKLVFIQSYGSSYGASYSVVLTNGSAFANSLWGNYSSSEAGTASAYLLRVTWGGNAVSWYNKTASSNQLNETSMTYYYIAIG